MIFTWSFWVKRRISCRGSFDSAYAALKMTRIEAKGKMTDRSFKKKFRRFYFSFYLLHFELVSTQNRPQNAPHDLWSRISHNCISGTSCDTRPCPLTKQWAKHISKWSLCVRYRHISSRSCKLFGQDLVCALRIESLFIFCYECGAWERAVACSDLMRVDFCGLLGLYHP